MNLSIIIISKWYHIYILRSCTREPISYDHMLTTKEYSTRKSVSRPHQTILLPDFESGVFEDLMLARIKSQVFTNLGLNERKDPSLT